MLSPLLYTMYTSNGSPSHPPNLIITFADDTTVVGLISGGDEEQYRDEVQQLSTWCASNNLLLNTRKTKVINIDFRRSPAPAPLHLNGECVERVPSFTFLGTNISEELSWPTNQKAIRKKGQQRLHFLRNLRKKHIEQKLLAHLLHHSLVYREFRSRQEGSAEGHRHSSEDRRLPSAQIHPQRHCPP